MKSPSQRLTIWWTSVASGRSSRSDVLSTFAGDGDRGGGGARGGVGIRGGGGSMVGGERRSLVAQQKSEANTTLIVQSENGVWHPNRVKSFVWHPNRVKKVVWPA